MHREPDVGLDSGSPGSRPGPKAGAKPLRHPGIPGLLIFTGRREKPGSSDSSHNTWRGCGGSDALSMLWEQLPLLEAAHPPHAGGRQILGHAGRRRHGAKAGLCTCGLGHLQPTSRHGLRGGWSLRGQEAGGSTPHRDGDPELRVSQRRVQACPPLAHPEGSGSRRPRPRCPQPLPARSRALQPLTSGQTGRPESLGGRQGSSYEGARGIRCEPATTRTDKFAR
ncbi:hypothetical protein VULLAG_LOCUS3200 [Vulpes lagopus]